MGEKAVVPDAHKTIRFLILAVVLATAGYYVKTAWERGAEKAVQECPMELKRCQAATATSAAACQREVTGVVSEWRTVYNSRQTQLDTCLDELRTRRQDLDRRSGEANSTLEKAKETLYDAEVKAHEFVKAERERTENEWNEKLSTQRRRACKQMAVQFGFDDCK